MRVVRSSIAGLLLVALVAGGCAGGGGSDAESLERALLAEEARGAMRRLTGADNGLELRKWLITDDAGRIPAIVAEYGDGDALDETRTRALHRNGLRFVRLPVENVRPMLDALGGTGIDVQGWQGQMLQWQPLHELTLENRSAIVAIDGRVRRYEGGRFGLMARSWTVPMEDGPFLQLELVPQYRRAAPAIDLLQLLGRRESGGEVFDTMAIDTRLEMGHAYLLTCVAPGDRWSIDEDAVAATSVSAAPGVGVGPEVLTPQTLGQLLLWSEIAGRSRGMLLFIPRIPPEMFPPELLVDRGEEGPDP